MIPSRWFAFSPRAHLRRSLGATHSPLGDGACMSGRKRSVTRHNQYLADNQSIRSTLEPTVPLMKILLVKVLKTGAIAPHFRTPTSKIG